MPMRLQKTATGCGYVETIMARDETQRQTPLHWETNVKVREDKSQALPHPTAEFSWLLISASEKLAGCGALPFLQPYSHDTFTTLGPKFEQC